MTALLLLATGSPQLQEVPRSPEAPQSPEAPPRVDEVATPMLAGAEATPPPSEEPPACEWSVAASLAAYFVPKHRDHVQPTLELDYRWLHFEGRYNYEAIDAGSTWLGSCFAMGETVTFEATPMAGFVFGHPLGVAPGYKLPFGWWWLELYSEGEYVIDVEHIDDSFFYTWPKLTVSSLEWLRLGLVTQRTRAYESDVDIQRGLLLGLSHKDVDLAAHVVNLG